MSKSDDRLRNSNGFSLIELLVVIGILAILSGIAVVFGHDWLVRSQVEEQTREMFTDLMSARVSAMQSNRVYFVTLAANQYSIYEDTYDTPDGNGNLDPGQDALVKQKTTAYALSPTGTISFSSCGLACGLVSDESYTIHVISTVEPTFDCIVLNPTRILMGKWDGTDCALQ